MASRKDQAQAYRFVMRRQTAALLDDHPDGPDVPTRRLAVAMVLSVVLAGLVVAGFGIFGLISPGGSTSWKNGKELIVEKGTDTRLVYAGGVLHPVLNYASARLLIGSSYTVDSVSSSSLSGVPRGLPVGIPGAPDELPSTGSLVTAPWTTCSIPAADASGTGTAPYVRLTLGGGTVGTVLPSYHGLLVSAPDGTTYLVWDDQRFRLDGSAERSLSYGTAQPIEVGAAWLNTVPAGPDLTPLGIPRIGSQAPAIGNLKVLVGQVFSASGVGTTPQLYAAYPDGLAAITDVQADLLLGDGATRAAYPGGTPQPIPLNEGQLGEAAMSAQHPSQGSDLPSTAPSLAGDAGSGTEVCSTFGDTTGESLNVTISTLTLTPGQLAAVPAGTAPVAAQGGPLADHVAVTPGAGAVVRELPAPGVTTGTVYLVTDIGVKFPLTSVNLLSSLGLSGVSPTPVPAGVLQLLRTGPRLDQTDAAETAAVLPNANGSPQALIPIPGSTAQ